MSLRRAYVIGGGLAGLSAAVRLASRGVKVELIEGAAQAGGRCRSYFDPQLGLVIDNGNHLVLSGNAAIHDYVETIGAEGGLVGPEIAEFHYVDLSTGERWSVRPNMGPLAWWPGSAKRRVPGTRTTDYLALRKLLLPRRGASVEETISTRGVLWDRLLGPFLLAALNTPPETASAELAGAIVRETLVKGGRAYRPRIAHPTLAAVLVDPALAYLESRGGTVRLGKRLRALKIEDDRVIALELPDGDVAIGPEDAVILALPPWRMSEMIPGVTAPDAYHAIVNAHFRISAPKALLGEDVVSMVGVLGGTVEWIFAFEDRISVTVSAADRLVDEDRESLAHTLWADVARALDMPPELPPWQVVKERRATFAATPEQDAKRPSPATAYRNLWLAGDWIATGLPATLEGAVRSGHGAAERALKSV